MSVRAGAGAGAGAGAHRWLRALLSQEIRGCHQLLELEVPALSQATRPRVMRWGQELTVSSCRLPLGVPVVPLSLVQSQPRSQSCQESLGHQGKEGLWPSKPSRAYEAQSPQP